MSTRAHFRRLARQTLRLKASVETDDWSCDATTVDISLEGACLELKEALQPGRRLRVSVLAPQQWEPVALGATVAWSARAPAGVDYRAGLRFEPASPATVRTLLELLDASLY